MAHGHDDAREVRDEHTDDYPREGDYIVSYHYPEDPDDGGPGWFVNVWCGYILGIFDTEDEAWEEIRADARRYPGDYRVWYAEDDGRLPSLVSTERVAEPDES